jgi:hypothetical protein
VAQVVERRVPALQVWSPEFKLQSHKNKTKQKKPVGLALAHRIELL